MWTKHSTYTSLHETENNNLNFLHRVSQRFPISSSLELQVLYILGNWCINSWLPEIKSSVYKLEKEVSSSVELIAKSLSYNRAFKLWYVKVVFALISLTAQLFFVVDFFFCYTYSLLKWSLNYDHDFTEFVDEVLFKKKVKTFSD